MWSSMMAVCKPYGAFVILMSRDVIMKMVSCVVQRFRRGLRYIVSFITLGRGGAEKLQFILKRPKSMALLCFPSISRICCNVLILHMSSNQVGAAEI